MLPAIVTFVLCATIVIGAYWTFIVRPEANAGQALRRRLNPDSEARDTRTELTKNAPRMSALEALDTFLTHSGHMAGALQRTIALSALPVTVGMVLLASALAGVLTFAAISATSSLWLAVVLAPVLAAVPSWYVRRAARNRLARLEEQFPQAVDLMAASLRAGHAFTTALLMVAEEVAAPMGPEFRLVHDQQNYGKPLPDVLRAFADRVPLLDLRIFITAVLTQRETGGNLAEVLDKLSALVRERFRIRREVRTVSAHGRITGWVLVALPPVVAGALFVVAPAHIMTLVNDPIGLRLTAGAVFLQLVGAFTVRRIVTIEL